MVNPRYSAL